MSILNKKKCKINRKIMGNEDYNEGKEQDFLFFFVTFFLLI